ncbi:hypothetical protein [Actinoplanes regularis]|uniref:DUF4232 domain-containing protein n=1 Tax=Actinoplanes regularis TaxID=52697 RepID=A0A239G5H8_9ACTN|nr:hypothetical protein [Actinoplanes regularis]GIE90441.1 hypothetical protein Are01nite_69210 [Actinoplanes regularis]SNS64360.1 hypothetical protein SAMN06264365_12033 [Actinoplanes regularis]
MNTKLRRGILAAAITLGATLGVASAAAAVTGPGTTAAPAPAAAQRITVAEPVALNASVPAEPAAAETTTEAPAPAGTEAAPETAARPNKAVLSATATDLVYGQPDATGLRGGSNIITITNRGTQQVEFPMLTFPVNQRDVLTQNANCTYMAKRGTELTCIIDPLAAGESRELALPWQTRQESGPVATVRARLQQVADREGTPIAGTASKVSWKVSFAQLTGIFTIKATPLAYSAPDEVGVRHGSTHVTIRNVSTETVQFPTITFQTNGAAAVFADWTGCVQTFNVSWDAACVEAPLAPGEERTLEFPFQSDGPMLENDASVRVEAATDVNGSVIAGTAVGTTYHVTSPSDN